jgi:MFS family permease
VAVGWELYERMGDALALGLVGLVQVVPVILLSLPAGHAADRYPRKTIVMATQAVLAAASLALAVISATRAPVGWMYVCLAVAGAAMAFANPARWALTPQLVPAADFPNAIAWRTSAWQVSSVVGPGLGGAVLGWGSRLGLSAWLGGAAQVFLLDTLLSVVVVLTLSGIAPRPRPGSVEPLTRESLLAGVRFVWRSKTILATITLDMFAVLLGGATALLPIYAKDILHVGEFGFGCLRSAPSIGAVAMALALAHRTPLQRPGRALLLSVAGFGLATLGFGLSRDAAFSFVMLLLAGALDNISMVVRGTLVQVLTPDAMRGRVSAVNSVFIGMSNELGAFESGLTAWLWGPVASVVVGGAGCIAVVIAVMARWPEVLRLGPLAGLKPVEPEAEPEAVGDAPITVEGPA